MLEQDVKTECYHCGNDCEEELLTKDDHNFCCNGCLSVYNLLKENDLCDYYSIENNPGITLKSRKLERFSFLDDTDVIASFIEFEDEERAHVTFYVPQIHCYSCLWLLEKLHVLRDGILSSKTNYLKKEVTIAFQKDTLSLRQVVELLTSIGYEPVLNLEQEDKSKRKSVNRKSFIQIGLTGFCFGNIMLLSFPEYVSGFSEVEPEYAQYFGLISLFLSLPIMIWGARDYLSSAYHSLRQLRLNLDVPISLGIVTLFVVSSYEVLSVTGAGYFDSLAGLIFFLLIGKSFQQKTFDQLNFERDYKSYFPLAITKLDGSDEVSIPVSKVEVGDRLIIRNEEIIPSDSILMSISASVDYSFVTGESVPETKVAGEKIYAGGRVAGKAVEVEVIKEASQSYLTRLWNKHEDEKKDEDLESISDRVGKYFTYVVLFLSVGAGLFWFRTDVSIAIKAFTSVLIVACPCALALAIPFTYGNSIRLLARKGFYLKSASVIERMASVNHLIFDKTGTLTDQKKSFLNYEGEALTDEESSSFKSLLRHSSHPLSQLLFKHLKGELCEVEDFSEKAGKGIEGVVNGRKLKLGSAQFVGVDSRSQSTSVFLSINDEYKGSFLVESGYRKGLRQMFQSLSKRFGLSLLSGDSDKERTVIDSLTDRTADTHFKQSPFDKRNHILELQKDTHRHVAMIGDGLNDAGALRASDVGISVTENVTHFTPASDGILDADHLVGLPSYFTYSKIARFIVYVCFGISFCYNLVGLFFAVRGDLSPIIAAVLMPVSSITVVVFSVLSTNFMARRVLDGKRELV